MATKNRILENVKSWNNCFLILNLFLLYQYSYNILVIYYFIYRFYKYKSNWCLYYLFFYLYYTIYGLLNVFIVIILCMIIINIERIKLLIINITENINEKYEIKNNRIYKNTIPIFVIVDNLLCNIDTKSVIYRILLDLNIPKELLLKNIGDYINMDSLLEKSTDVSVDISIDEVEQLGGQILEPNELNEKNMEEININEIINKITEDDIAEYLNKIKQIDINYMIYRIFGIRFQKNIEYTK